LTNTRSTGRHREPRGQNVLRSVVVSVVLCAASFATPSARAEIETIANESASAAGLAARVPAIDLHELASVPAALVLQLPCKLGPSGVADAPRQRPIADHPTDVEIFDDDRLVFANEPSAQLVEMVPTAVGNTGMQARQLESSLLSVPGSFLGASITTRERALARQLSVVMAGVGDVLAGGERHQTAQSDVEADGSLELQQWFDRRVVAEDRHVPATCSIEAYGDTGRLDAIGQRARPADHQRRHHLREIDLAVLHSEGATCVDRRSPVVSPLEAGVLRALREEVGVGRLKVPQRLLQRHTRDLVQERQLFGPLPRGQHAILLGVADGFLAAGPRLRARMQGFVVDQSTASQRAPQYRLLLQSWLEAVAEGANHDYSLRLADVTGKTTSRPEGRGFNPWRQR